MTPLWFAIIGSLLVLMSLIGFAVTRWPVSPSMIYLFIGLILGPMGFGILEVDAVRDAEWLLVAFEITVLISLFSVGLKLRMPFSDRLWRLPLKLASLSMFFTIGCLVLLSHWLLNYSWPLAVLFGAIMAPTDPVLASDVQVREPGDKDRLRFAVTAEGGMNDGTAFPFVFLGLGLLGLHELGPDLSHWLARDVVWGIGGGLLVGAACGVGIGRLILWYRARREEPVGLEEFLSLGLIGLSYGLACMLHTLGFLAVLAAGIAMRRLESQGRQPLREQADVLDSESPQVAAPGHMLESVLTFNERFERIAEVGAVLLLGGLMSNGYFTMHGVIVAAVLMFVVRPASVFLVTPGSRTTMRQRWLISWFGVRGVGSLYYLMFAIHIGLRTPQAEALLPIVLTVVAASITLHGMSATPLMSLYARRHR
ncbi:sodium:proton antiporter [Uliginosibacterium sp. H3]|uniref:Sodium:proton antiporter n=1 Tax=Uliginosibacterium silvisoli TaxID=3114758 RepID=A0ABU6K899_9RHOO|nr:sodium:proton antiporter [Uliginosibacterium sp. H3]